MAHRILLIPEIKPDTRNWTARVTLTEDIPAMTCKNSSKMKRYIFTDDEGNEIVATIFGHHIPILVPILQLFKVYDITNAQVRPVEEQYKILSNPLQWTLQRDTFIRPISDVGPNLRYFLDGLTPFSLIARDSDSEAKLNSVNIMGVVLAYENPTIASTEFGLKDVQRFTFVDMEKIPICVSIWGEMSKLQGPILTEAARNLSVVVAKHLGQSSYKGGSLSGRNSSSYAINPPLQAVTDLKAWIDSKSELELEELLVDQKITISKDLVETGHKRTYTVAELANITKIGDYWVKGFLEISNEDQRFYYIGCSNCSSKTSADKENLEYICNTCHATAFTVAKPLVVMLITDHVTTIKVLAVDSVAERILQTTAANIYRLSEKGQDYDVETIKAELHGRTFLMLLRRTFGQQNQSQRKMILTAFYDQADSSGSSQSNILTDTSSFDDENAKKTSKGEMTFEIQFPISPLKRQMSEVTITAEPSIKKKMLNMGDTSEANDDESSIPET